jgi:hypothetical protein
MPNDLWPAVDQTQDIGAQIINEVEPFPDENRSLREADIGRNGCLDPVRSADGCTVSGAKGNRHE